MKRFSLLFVFMTYFLSCLVAQKISVDRIEDNGSRQIMIDTKKYKIDGIEYSMGLKVYVSSYDKNWLLLISSFNIIPRTTVVLLKLGNEEILNLPVNNVNVGKVTMPGYAIPIGVITTYSPSKEVDYYSSVYVLTEEEIKKIEEFGIKKIRIFDGLVYRDKEFVNNSLGKHLTRSYKKIKNCLEKKNNPKGLYEGF